MAGGWFSLTPKGSYGMGLCKEIEKEVCMLKQNCEIRLGNGVKIKFWDDAWRGRRPLSEVFPELYSNVGSKGGSIANL